LCIICTEYNEFSVSYFSSFDRIIVWKPSDLTESEFLIYLSKLYSNSTLLVDTLHDYDSKLISAISSSLNICFFNNYSSGSHYGKSAIFPIAHLTNKHINDYTLSYGNNFFHGFNYTIISRTVNDCSYNPYYDKPYISIFFGGSDHLNLLSRYFEGLIELSNSIPILVHLGVAFSDRDKFLGINSYDNLNFVDFSHSSLFSSSLLFSTFGVITYECVFKMLPVFTIGHDETSHARAKRFASLTSCSFHLGIFSDVSNNMLVRNLRDVFNSDLLSQMSFNQSGKIDNFASKRIWHILRKLSSV